MAGTRRKPAGGSSVEIAFDFNYATKNMVRFEAQDEDSGFRQMYIPKEAADQLELSEGQGIVVTISAA